MYIFLISGTAVSPMHIKREPGVPVIVIKPEQAVHGPTTSTPVQRQQSSPQAVGKIVRPWESPVKKVSLPSPVVSMPSPVNLPRASINTAVSQSSSPALRCALPVNNTYIHPQHPQHQQQQVVYGHQPQPSSTVYQQYLSHYYKQMSVLSQPAPIQIYPQAASSTASQAAPTPPPPARVRMTQCDSGYMSQYPGEGSSSGSDSDTQQESCQKRYLSSRAVFLMEQWYQHNFDHPYPSEDSVAMLAKEGSINGAQVKKWMANKRVRSFNTLSFNGSIHPKKLKRLQREHLARHGYSLNQSSSSQKSTSASKRVPNIPLPLHSRHSLNVWYDEHVEHPYPTEAEKAELSSKTGLTLSQVKCWFANKRSRSNRQKPVTASNVYDLLDQRSLLLQGACLPTYH